MTARLRAELYNYDKIKPKSVLLYYANLIGYLRVTLLFVSIWCMQLHPMCAAVCYAVSALLDGLDGYLARAFNECSRFGSILDQLTDRCSMLALLMQLAGFYPEWSTFWQYLAVLDISSHWLYMYAVVASGKTSHKQVDEYMHPILRLYYGSAVTLTTLVAGNETFTCCMYLYHFTSGPIIYGTSIGLFQILAALSLPLFAIKNFVNIFHMHDGVRMLVDMDQHDRQDCDKNE